jgi:hypothetical protein
VNSFEERYRPLVELLAIVAKDGIYTPFDKIMRAIDRDTVMTALYDVLRYIAPDLKRCRDYFACLQIPEEDKRGECIERYSGSEYERCREIERVIQDPSKLVESMKMLDDLVEEVSKGSLTRARKLAMLAVRRSVELTLKEKLIQKESTRARPS